MIGPYSFKAIEEVIRGVAVAVVAAVASAIYSQGVPTTREGIVALLIGVLPIAYAAVRAALTKARTPSPSTSIATTGTSVTTSGSTSFVYAPAAATTETTYEAEPDVPPTSTQPPSAP